MISSGIIFRNSCLMDVAGVLTLTPARTDLSIPFEFALNEPDTRQHRERGYILTAVNAPPGVESLIPQLFRSHDWGKGWEVRLTASSVVHKSVHMGSIYDYQHWTKDDSKYQPTVIRTLMGLNGQGFSYERILQVCAMTKELKLPALTRQIDVETPGIIEAPHRPRKALL